MDNECVYILPMLYPYPMVTNGKWVRVSIPRDLLNRVVRLFEKKGMASPSEYVRHAIIQQLELDEKLLGGKENEEHPD